MASTSNQNPQGPILSSNNYEMWTVKMRSFLRNLECWEAVVTKFEEPDPTDLATMTNNQRNVVAESRKKDSRALWHLHNGVEDAIFPKISAATNAYQAWEILATAYQGFDKVRNSKL